MWKKSCWIVVIFIMTFCLFACDKREKTDDVVLFIVRCETGEVSETGKSLIVEYGSEVALSLDDFSFVYFVNGTEEDIMYEEIEVDFSDVNGKPDLGEYKLVFTYHGVSDSVCVGVQANSFAYGIVFSQGEKSTEIWEETDTYTSDYATKTLYKKSGKDFVIVNFADTQIDYPSDLAKKGIIYKTIKDSIDTYHPDLITFSGDNAWGTITKMNYEKIVAVLDGFETPWAITFGNHDHQGNADLNYLGEIVQNSKYGIFGKGPRNIGGVGNYSVNIVDEDTGKVIHSVILMDSGDSGLRYDGDEYTYDAREGKSLPAEMAVYAQNYDAVDDTIKIGSSYAGITPEQVRWYEWLVKGLQKENDGETVETTCIFHIPFIQYYYAYRDWAEADETGRAEMEPVGKMRLGEMVACAAESFGLYEKMAELGSTKNVIVGHDHVNDFSLKTKDGIRLTYAVKTGDECYWTKDGSMNGSTVLTIGSDGVAHLEQHYFQEK